MRDYNWVFRSSRQRASLSRAVVQLQVQVSLLSRQLQVGGVELQRARTHNQFLQRRLQQLIHCSATTASDLAALRSVHAKLTGQLGCQLSCQLSASPAASPAVSAVPGHQPPSKQSREDKESGNMEVGGSEERAEQRGSDKAVLRARPGSSSSSSSSTAETEGHDHACSHIKSQEDAENKMQNADQKMHW